MNRNIVERISTHCSAFVNRLTCKINSILLLLCTSLIENFGDLSGKERFPHVQIICKYASTSRWRWQHWSSDLHSDPQGRRKVGGVSSNVVGTICPPVEIELTDLSKFGSGCMTSQPSGSDSPDVAAVLCWLDYWADQPRRRKNVHNFKEDQLVLYSTVAVPYSKWKKWCPLPKVQSVQMQTVKNDCRSCRGSLYSIGPLPA